MASEENLNETRDEDFKKSSHVFWKNLTVQYWYYLLIFVLIAAGAIAGFLLTLNWYVNKTALGSGALTIAEMSIRSSIVWIVMLFVWEILIVAIPTFIVGGGFLALIWFVLFPEDVKEDCKKWTKKEETEADKEFKKKYKKKSDHRSSQSGGAFTFLVSIGFLIYIAVDGNWNAPFSTAGMTIGYFLGRWIEVFLWGLLILGVPALTFGLLWYWKKFGKE